MEAVAEVGGVRVGKSLWRLELGLSACEGIWPLVLGAGAVRMACLMRKG